MTKPEHEVSREDVLGVACPVCTAAPGSTLGQVGEPCCDVGGGRVQMVCIARVEAARATPQSPAAPHECPSCDLTDIARAIVRMMELGDYGERCIPVVAGILGDWLDDSRARLRTVEQERDRLLGVVDGIFQDFEDLLVVATKDVDADGFVSAYHFKTGAIHRMLGKVRQRYGLTTPVASPPQGIPEGGTMRDSCGYPKKDTP